MRHDAAAIVRAELRFREGIWLTAPVEAMVEQKIQRRRFGPLLATVYAGLPESRVMNMIQGAAEPGAVEGGHLAEAVEWMRSWEVEYLVAVAAERPESLQAEAWLADRGYEQGPSNRRYLRATGGVAGLDPPSVRVRELSPEQTEGMSLIFAEALELSDLATISLLELPRLPGWHCYAADLDGFEVACGAMLIDNGIAILGLDATSSEARQRGCHSALIRRRLIDAKRAGCHTVFAEACDGADRRGAAARNLLRAGFVETGRSVAWRRPVLTLSRDGV